MVVPERQCAAYTSPVEIARSEFVGPDDPNSYIFEVTAAERPLKLLKDLLWVVLIGICLFTINKGRAVGLSLLRPWPMLALMAYALAACLLAVVAHGALVAAAGLRSFMFLVVGLLGLYLVPHMSVFARAVAALLVLQMLLVPVELFRGIHIFREWSHLSLASRVAGSMVQPNSMGVFAAAGWVFCYCFSRSRKGLAALGVLALVLILLSGSATGLLCMALFFFVLLRQRVGAKWRPIILAVGALAVGLVMWSLPTLTGRPDVFNSVGAEGGRLSNLLAVLLERSPLRVALGDGLGVNTNAALNLFEHSVANASGSVSATTLAPTDSTLTGLLIQIGAVGTLLFYGSLLWAALRDPVARPFYGVVAVCTLSINLTELFPVNLLLGLALAHSVWREPGAEPGPAGRGQVHHG